jgi:hypothetical protein
MRAQAFSLRREREASMKPERIVEAIEKVGNPYALCVLLAKRGKQIHHRFYSGNSSFARSFNQVLDEIITGDLRFTTPDRQKQEEAG